MHARSGDHVVDGETVATVHRPDTTDQTPNTVDSAADTVRSHVTLGATRTPHQDIQFAVQQLAEVAVRALSPSMNDPYTARNAFHELAAALVPLAVRPKPVLGRADSGGQVRLVVARLTVTDLLDDIFGAVRTYALDAPIAMTAALMLARRIGAATHDKQIRDHVLHHLELIDSALDRAVDTGDAQFCRGEIDQARHAVRRAAHGEQGLDSA